MSEVRTSFQMTDGWHHVFRRVMNDMVKGNTECNAEGIHWDWYFRQYTGMQAFAAAVSVLTKEPEEQPEPEKQDENSDSEYTETVFGGDYANQNSPPG